MLRDAKRRTAHVCHRYSFPTSEESYRGHLVDGAAFGEREVRRVYRTSSNDGSERKTGPARDVYLGCFARWDWSPPRRIFTGAAHDLENNCIKSKTAGRQCENKIYRTVSTVAFHLCDHDPRAPSARPAPSEHTTIVPRIQACT